MLLWEKPNTIRPRKYTHVLIITELYGHPVMFLKYKITVYNPAMHNINAANLGYSLQMLHQSYALANYILLLRNI